MDNSVPPPLLPDSASDDESYFEDSYFYNNYVPVSNLPTPPIPRAKGILKSRYSLRYDGEDLDKEYLGPAILLTNLIPLSTSLSTPSLPLVHAILSRASLPPKTVALAICILDSLTSKFARTWRRNCPLSPPPNLTSSSSSGGEEHDSEPSTLDDAQQTKPHQKENCDNECVVESEARQHIDSVRPEIIALCAIILAMKYVDDTLIATSDYATEWGRGMWTCQQINFTEWALFEDLKYRLLDLWDERVINECLVDMERAGNESGFSISDDDELPEDIDSGNMSADAEITWVDVDNLTPPYTPLAITEFSACFGAPDDMITTKHSIGEEIDLSIRTKNRTGEEFIAVN